VLCLLSNHFFKQPLWKKCLQDNSLTSSSASNPQRHTQHSIVAHHPLPVLSWHKDLTWVIEIVLSLAPSGHPSGYSSIFGGFLLARPTTCSTDLTAFFRRATEKTVFITSTGSTPSAALGKFESPIFYSVAQKKLSQLGGRVYRRVREEKEANNLLPQSTYQEAQR
jgi:hypothetical protein